MSRCASAGAVLAESLRSAAAAAAAPCKDENRNDAAGASGSGAGPGVLALWAGRQYGGSAAAIARSRSSGSPSREGTGATGADSPGPHSSFCSALGAPDLIRTATAVDAAAAPSVAPPTPAVVQARASSRGGSSMEAVSSRAMSIDDLLLRRPGGGPRFSREGGLLRCALLDAGLDSALHGHAPRLLSPRAGTRLGLAVPARCDCHVRCRHGLAMHAVRSRPEQNSTRASVLQAERAAPRGWTCSTSRLGIPHAAGPPRHAAAEAAVRGGRCIVGRCPSLPWPRRPRCARRCKVGRAEAAVPEAAVAGPAAAEAAVAAAASEPAAAAPGCLSLSAEAADPRRPLPLLRVECRSWPAAYSRDQLATRLGRPRRAAAAGFRPYASAHVESAIATHTWVVRRSRRIKGLFAQVPDPTAHQSTRGGAAASKFGRGGLDGLTGVPLSLAEAQIVVCIKFKSALELGACTRR
eukprot:354033-Chlamydomonas_euryale.AAC.4